MTLVLEFDKNKGNLSQNLDKKYYGQTMVCPHCNMIKLRNQFFYVSPFFCSVIDKDTNEIVARILLPRQKFLYTFSIISGEHNTSFDITTIYRAADLLRTFLLERGYKTRLLMNCDFKVKLNSREHQHCFVIALTKLDQFYQDFNLGTSQGAKITPLATKPYEGDKIFPFQDLMPYTTNIPKLITGESLNNFNFYIFTGSQTNYSSGVIGYL